MIELKCQQCGTTFTVPNEKAGHKGKCSHCGRALMIPFLMVPSESATELRPKGAMDLGKATSILGLREGAKLWHAKKAYRRLLKRFHPDAGTEPAADRFLEIVAAYNFLAQHFVTEEPRLQVIAKPRTDLIHSKYEDFVWALEHATRESIKEFHSQKADFEDRLKGLIRVQVLSYTSASEFRERLQGDVDAITQKEAWAFIQRIARRCQLVQQGFGSWVTQIRDSAYEISVPWGMMDYLSRLDGLILSGSFFLVLVSTAYLAMYMSPLPFFDKGPGPILAGILAVTLSGIISLWGGKTIYMRAARKQEKHRRHILMSQIGMDTFQVGAMPASHALSSQERAALAGGPTAILGMWWGVEPVTAAVMTGIVALLASLTGSSLGKMKNEASEKFLTALEPRLTDFYDTFGHNLLKFSDSLLERMQVIYVGLVGPDDSPIAQLTRLFTPDEVRLLTQPVDVRNTGGAEELTDHGEDKRELVARIRDLVLTQVQGDLYVTPQIPDKKLANAIAYYAKDARASEILVLYDASVWGGAKKGCCLTSRRLFWRNEEEEPGDVFLSNVRDIRDGEAFVEIDGRRILVNDRHLACTIAGVIREVKKNCQDSNTSGQS